MSLPRKALLVLVGLVALNALSRIGATRPGLLVEMLAAWSLFGYILWRAWPAVRNDCAGFSGRFSALRPGRNAGKSGRDAGSVF